MRGGGQKRSGEEIAERLQLVQSGWFKKNVMFGVKG